ncbi:MAG TPA: 2-isopropylmalate synthase [Methanomassiliicoccales archaeon]|jgi:2-isopropylmalate synthase|nr:2-isopropylmalate synthase [Methanomassiliicoccales archaeon]
MTELRSSCSQDSGAHGGYEAGRIFTSHFNRLALDPSTPERVEVLDTTLRDGEQTPGVALSIDDKVRIAQLLDELGVDVIEAGFPRTSKGEQEAIRRIASLGLKAKVCGLARCSREDVDSAVDSGVDYVHAFIATSEAHMKHKLKMTREQVKARAVDAVEYARSRGVTVEFSCEDGTRTDLDFLKEMHIAVQEAGVHKINLPDTVGTMSPAAMEYLVAEVMKVTKVPLSIHCHDDFGLAVANSLAAVRKGARQVHVCVNGLGERAGNAALEEVVMGLLALLNVRTNIDTRKLGMTCRSVARMTGIPIPDTKAIVGNNAFAHESGIHVHGVLSDPSTYEALSPELVGMQRNIVMGKHSGAHSVKEKLAEYGISLPEGMLSTVVEKVKSLAESGKEVDDAELVALALHIQGQAEKERQHVKLKEFAVFTGMNITPTSTVAIEVDGKQVRSSNVGIGPVDAALNAIRTAVSENISLVEYKLNAITGGSDALCEVTVKMRMNDDQKVMSVGKSIGSDIVLTSVDAAMGAIDRLLARHRE